MRSKNRRRRRRQTEYWVYAKANQMKEHRFTDDVALCKASSKSEAIKRFSILYTDIHSEDVYKLATGSNVNKPGDRYYNLWVLTDY